MLHQKFCFDVKNPQYAFDSAERHHLIEYIHGKQVYMNAIDIQIHCTPHKNPLLIVHSFSTFFICSYQQQREKANENHVPIQ